MVCENMSWYSWFAPRIIPYLTQKAPILYCELPKYVRYAYFDTRGEFTYESTGTWFVWYARTCSSTHGLHLVSYHILRIEYIFCTKSSTDSVFRKANIFTVQASKLISTYVEKSKNSIEGEFRSGMIYEQSIRWGRSDVQVPFSLSTIIVFCSCKYFNKETVQHGFCCKHIIGQLRRVLHMT